MPTAKVDPLTGYDNTHIGLYGKDIVKSPVEAAVKRFFRRTKLEQVEDRLHDEISRFYADPFGFAMFAYEWGESGPLAAYPNGPDTWQKEFLIELGEEIKKRKFDGVTPVAPIMMTRSSGKGIGKSALVAIVVDFIMSTRPDCQGIITANTFPQLQSKTWAAIQTWTKRCITAHWFECSSTKLYHARRPESWFTTAQTAKEENSESFAGQHAAQSTQFYCFDEASAIPNKIFEVAESGMTDGEPMIFVFGNPTRNSGKFFQINFGYEKDYWKRQSIDGRECALTNKVQIREWAERYGEDSDFFRVYVRGLPPNAGDLQFIDNERVAAAMRRQAQCLKDDPLIAGVDVSRGGKDDTVIRFRKGLDARTIPPLKISGDEARDSMIVASKLADILIDRRPGRAPDAMFVDSAFGGPIVNRLRQLGHKNVFEVNFGNKSPDPHFGNMRAFMWGKMKEWLLSGAIDKDPDLEVDLTGPGFKHDKKERLILESKEDMAERGLDSPDDGDALCLCFAEAVAPPRSRAARRTGYSAGPVSAWS